VWCVCVCVCVCAGEIQAAWEIMILYDCTARQKKPHTAAAMVLQKKT